MTKCTRCPNEVVDINPRNGQLYKKCKKCRDYGSSSNKKYNATKPKRPLGICQKYGCYSDNCTINPQTGKHYYYCEECRISNSIKMHTWYLNNSSVQDARTLENYRKWRKLAIDRYGGKCTCCGETDDSCLALDHIDGGGKKDRANRSSTKIYRDAALNYQPDKYRIFCHNCNAATAIYGSCPHMNPGALSVFLNKTLTYNGVRYRKYRGLFLDLYGGKCMDCGESNSAFLVLDHINGGGRKHRNSRGVMGIYMDACSDRDLSKYQILCWNCNWSKWLKVAA